MKGSGVQVKNHFFWSRDTAQKFEENVCVVEQVFFPYP